MRPRFVSVLGCAAIAAALASGCGDQCYLFPTSVELVLDRPYVEAPGVIEATAETMIGSATCGASPTEVVAYHWRLDGEPLEAEDDDEPLGDSIVVAFDAPGVYVLEVRIEDDLGKELPYVGRSSILVY
jgi:hypothetical protein